MLFYSNVFAIGDCANTPNAKTAAAVGKTSKNNFEKKSFFS